MVPRVNERHPSDLQAILDFYVQAGVDTLLSEAPVDRFIAEPAPLPGPVSAGQRGLPAPQSSPNSPGSPDETTVAGATSRRRPAPERRATGPAGWQVAAAEAPAVHPPDAAIMAAREAARSATDLDALRAILDRFEGCGLRFTANRLVFADGNPRARTMFVGEAPGREEDLAGLPFVGPSGKLLDRMMAAIGLDRTSAYIANVIPWRPPGNRTPTPQESQICLPFIRRQIELADPDTLVCLGGPSAQALLGLADGIRRARGRWHNYQTGTREIRAIATFHPAYLLRTPVEKRFAWRDFLAIKMALSQ
jgi:uracil-DNA glycosylase